MPSDSAEGDADAEPGQGPSLTRDASGVYHGYHDVGSEGVAETITMLLSRIDGREPTELVEDFGQYADPDALDRLVGGRNSGLDHVQLDVAGYEVRVDRDGEIRIRE